MICQKKNKRLCAFCSFCLLLCLVVQCLAFCVPSYASETSTTQSVSDYFRENDFYDTCAFVCRKYASFPYMDYLTGANSGITYDAWVNYLDSQDKLDLLNEDVTISGSGGGRGYDMPQDVRQELVNFVSNTYITDNPLSYTPCYIYSYKFLDPTIFPNYQSYINTQTLIKNFDGYTFISGFWDYGSRGKAFNFCQLSHSAEVGWIGTTLEGGFTNVRPYVNWVTYGPNLTRFYVNSATTENMNTGVNLSGTRNVSSFNSTYYTVFSSYDKNELVYVFDSLNAYKAYNAGTPQSYYMPTGSSTVVPYYDGFTSSDIARAGQFYNTIVNNVSSDDTPTDILRNVDSVLKSGLGSSSDSSSSSGILGGLSDIIAGATGAITPIGDLVTGDLKQFVQDIFGWLPPQIITIWIAGITFAVFFGVLKVIRG